MLACHFIKKERLACNFIKKETLAQIFSRKFCEISKNTFSYKTHPMAASISNLSSIGCEFSKVCKDQLKASF